jgi:antitoxin component YwqK of YwqJK toxin-antitoxin module
MITLRLLFLTAFAFTSTFSFSQHQKRETKYEDGTPREVFYALEKGNGNFVRDGEYKSWYPNGHLETQGQYKEGKRAGSWKHWYKNSQLQSEETYSLDVLDGRYMTWYENGQKKIDAQALRGKYVNHYMSWFDNGQVEFDLTRDTHGNMIGLYTEWYRNGKMKWKGSADANALKIGALTFWDEKGRKIAEWNFDKGKLNGSIKFWDANGRLYVHREFKDSVDIDLPANYKRNGTTDILELKKGETFKLTYADKYLGGNGGVKTEQGKFEINLIETEAYLKLGKFADGKLIKFNRDSIVYRNRSGVDIVFVKNNM